MDNKIIKRYSWGGLVFFNIALTAVYTVSFIWGGTAQTSSGITIPDTGLTIPFLIFILISAGQLIALILNQPIIAVVLCFVKLILFELSLYMLCGYSLSGSYMQSNNESGFYNNLTYSILIIISIIIGALSFLFELIACTIFKRRSR